MTKPDFIYQPEGATPIDDVSGLLQPHIVTLAQLNEAEALNSLAAHEWLERGRIENVFSGEFYQELHRRMLNDVWSWAGSFRKSNTNIGVPFHDIQMQVRNAALDYQAQWNSGSISLIEFIARYHHRLVWIHPFPNGNGRWSRLACDALVIRLMRKEPLKWTQTSNLIHASEERSKYIAALRAADKHDYSLLIEYLRVRNTE